MAIGAEAQIFSRRGNKEPSISQQPFFLLNAEGKASCKTLWISEDSLFRRDGATLFLIAMLSLQICSGRDQDLKRSKQKAKKESNQKETVCG